MSEDVVLKYGFLDVTFSANVWRIERARRTKNVYHLEWKRFCKNVQVITHLYVSSRMML